MQPRRSRFALFMLFLTATLIPVALSALAPAPPVLKTLTFQDDFSSGNLDAWMLPHPEDWQILSEGPVHYLHMKRSREPGVPRRPLQFALAKTEPFGSFKFEARVRREGRSMIVVFGYVDTLHFYYTHLSMDRGTEQPVHNGIFIVNGAPRKRIAGLNAPPALPDKNWHQVRVVRDMFNGLIQVFMDNQQAPLFSVEDRTFLCGRIGVGSFDETGDFADVRIAADNVGCVAGNRVQIRPADTH
jgi:hypothetical protein